MLTFALARAGITVFEPLPDEAADDPVHVQGRAPPGSFCRGELLLPLERPHRHQTLEGGLVLDPVPGCDLLLRRRDQVVVEAGDGDPPVPALQRRDGVSEGVERVRGNAPEDSRMEVRRGALGDDLGVEQPTEAGQEVGQPGCGELAVGDQDVVARDPAGVLAQEAGQLRAR